MYNLTVMLIAGEKIVKSNFDTLQLPKESAFFQAILSSIHKIH